MTLALFHRENLLIQLRWQSLQVLILMSTLTVFVGGSTAEPLGPCSSSSPGMSSSGPVAIDPKLFAINPNNSGNPSKQECNAVFAGMRGLKALVTPENAPVLGFKDPAEAAQAQSGHPFVVYLVHLADLRRFDPSGDYPTCDPPTISKVTCLLKPLGGKFYPLITTRPEDGGIAKTRSALVVSIRKGKNDNFVWTPTNWGLAPLAKDMTFYRGSVPAFQTGFIVWIPALNLHFLGDQFTEELMLVPLADRKAYGLTKGVPISAKIVFALYAREAKSLDEHSPG